MKLNELPDDNSRRVDAAIADLQRRMIKAFVHSANVRKRNSL